MSGKKDLLILLVLLILLPVTMGTQVTVTSTTGVNSVAIAQITDFSVTPTFTEQNQDIDFSVTVQNTGNLPINATAIINITDPSNNVVSNTTSTNVSISVGNEATIIVSWNTNGYSVGDYKGVVVLDYDGKSTSPSETTFTIQATAPPPAGGGYYPPLQTTPPPEEIPPPNVTLPPAELPPLLPPTIPPAEQPLGEARIRFVKFPIMEEIQPGETITADILVSNVGVVDVPQISVDIEGIPREWVDLKTKDMGLAVGGLKGINMVFSVPAGAIPGNYRVTTVLKSDESEARIFFILRVKPYPVEIERPIVTRSVLMDTQRSTSIITLKVENAGRFVQKLGLVEEIPKVLASNVKEVDFNVPPSEIIEADPVIGWTLENIDFYETRTLTYEVPRTLEEYYPYVNWPLRQINIFYEIKLPKEEIEISKAEISTLSPGKSGSLSVTVSNTGRTPRIVNLDIIPPSGWKIEPETTTRQLAPREDKVLNFDVHPPKTATLGVYTATLKLTYGDKTITKDVSMFVREPPAEKFSVMLWVLRILLITILVLLLRLGRHIYKKRRVYRKDVVSTIHKLDDEMTKAR